MWVSRIEFVAKKDLSTETVDKSVDNSIGVPSVLHAHATI